MRLFAIIAAVAALGSGLVSTALADPVGEVGTVIGAAERLRGGESTPVVQGLPVEAGDVLKTGPSARLRVRFVDGSTATLGVSSTMTVDRFDQSGGAGNRDASLTVTEGILRVVAETLGPSARFEVRTPTAVAATRSTVWIVEVTEKGTAVLTVDGRVAVAGTAPDAGPPVDVNRLEGTDVPPGGTPKAPAPWGRPRIDRVLDTTTLP